jgi:hypothetical protein
MADVTITGLPALSGYGLPSYLLEIVRDPAGTPVSEKMNIQQLWQGITQLTPVTTPGRLDYFVGVTNSGALPVLYRGHELLAIIDNLLTTGTFSLSDELAVYQVAGAGARKQTLQQLLDRTGGLGTFTDPQTGDLALVYDGSAAGLRAITLANLLAVLAQLTAFASTIDGANDLVGIWDQSAGAMRKLTLDQLFQVRQTVFIPAAAWTPRTTNGPAAGTAELATNKRMVKSLDFDASTQEYAQFPLWLPKSWDLSTLAYRVAWTSATGTGGVTWSLAARADGDDDALDQAMGTPVLVTDTRLADNDLHLTGESGALTAAGSAAEFDLVTLELSRAVADAGDTKTGDAKFLGLQLYYNTRYRTDA